jgi:D-alanyl-D-alanine carboxypeptidase/D-alanyl-D-alanine-endopeptidase (penicillin-binding protein 4)
MLQTLSLLFALLLASFASATPTDLPAQIGRLAHSKAGDVNVGVYVKDLTTHKVVLSLHGQRMFVPASTVKLFTSYMAYKHLGPEHQFKTVIYSEAKPLNGKLNADLCIRFVGDPTLKYEQLKDAFRALGLKQIKGNIVIDDSFFDNIRSTPGGFTWDDHPFYYAAPISAVIIDKNCAQAHMSPHEHGSKAKLHIDRPHALEIDNTVDTVAAHRKDCPYKSKYLGQNKYAVYGCMPHAQDFSQKLNFALQDNYLMIARYIDNILKEEGITLKGQIKIGTCNLKSEALHTISSPPLKEILKDVLENSCNLSTAALFKHIAAIRTKNPGNDEDGALILQDFLLAHNINKRHFKLFDGSGESRYNLVAPQALVDFLDTIYKDQTARPLFLDILAERGEGTLSYRLQGSKRTKRVYAKTGTLKHNMSLAGLYLPSGSHKYAFAIMLGNHNLDPMSAGALVDDILLLVLKNIGPSKKA